MREFRSGKGGDASSFATRHNQSPSHQYVPWMKGSCACIALFFRSRCVTIEIRVKSGQLRKKSKRLAECATDKKKLCRTHHSGRPPHRCNCGFETSKSPCRLCSGSTSSAHGVSMTALHSTKSAFADPSVIPLRVCAILCCAVAVVGLLLVVPLSIDGGKVEG